MKQIFIIFFIITLHSCTSEVQELDLPITNTPPDTTTVAAAPNYTIETVKGENGWGYHILINGKLFIRQHNIPSIQGNKGFDTEEQAKKVGEVVVHKLTNNIMPPSITPAELDSLGVLDSE